ncbi:MAG: peptidoglycan binding domain-containing protein, partial [Candidatus Promineifilaceae bacterium]
MSFFVVLAAATLMSLTSMTLLFFYSDVIFPGVQIIERPIGSMTMGRAAAMLEATIPQQEILLMHSSGAWPVTVTELGLAMDSQATMERAHSIGRTLEGLEQLVSGEWTVEPVWSVDEERALALFDRLAPLVEKPAVNAQIVVEKGEVREVPAQEGVALDREMSLSYLRENPTEIVRNGRLPLATRPVPAEIRDAGVYASEARRFLSKQVTIRAYDPILNETADWQILPRAWQAWLTLVVRPGESNPFSWNVDADAAQRYLADGWSWLGPERYLDATLIMPEIVDAITSGKTTIDARVYYQPRQHVVRPGESFSSIGYNYGIPYPWIQQANPGIDSLSVGDVVTIPSPDEMLPLPIVPNKRIVVSLSQQRAWVYEDGQQIWDWPASTGINNSPTSPGVFQIQTHEAQAYASNWDLYMPTFMGIYRPIPTSDFMNGFHGFPTRDG